MIPAENSQYQSVLFTQTGYIGSSKGGNFQNITGFANFKCRLLRALLKRLYTVFRSGKSVHNDVMTEKQEEETKVLNGKHTNKNRVSISFSIFS